jgi:hypothetical protein
MKEIIAPVNPELIESELTEERFVRHTNKAGNRIFRLDARSAPHTMREIGRLRELSFRQGGGGSGEELDIDRFDTLDSPYNQLIVWNPDAREIIGGYRFFEGKDASIKTDGQPDMAIEHIFDLSERFMTDYLPYTLELGRAFVQPKYQGAQGGLKSLFALDNLWDGIGAIVAERPYLKYIFGKVTIYSQTDKQARKAMIFYMQRHFGDRNGLLIPKKAEELTADEAERFGKMFGDCDYKEGFKRLSAFVRERGECVPPLIRSYIELSGSMRTFGTVFDPDFGDIYDTGLMITLADVYDIKHARYIMTYLKNDTCRRLRNFV